MDLDFEAIEELVQKEEKESQDQVSRRSNDNRSQKSFIREDTHKVISSSRSPRSQNSEHERSSRNHRDKIRNDEKYHNRERTRSNPRIHDEKSNGGGSNHRHSRDRSPYSNGKDHRYHQSDRRERERNHRDDDRDYHRSRDRERDRHRRDHRENRHISREKIVTKEQQE